MTLPAEATRPMQSVGGFCIPADHPSLPGHFPGRPIVPGVVLLDAALTLILAAHPGERVTGMPAVKFTHPVRPGEPVDVLSDSRPGRVAFACVVAGRDALRGSATLGPLL